MSKRSRLLTSDIGAVDEMSSWTTAVDPPAELGRGRSLSDYEEARDLAISEQTVYVWRRQQRVDQGVEPGLSSTERAELTAARRRIRELESELAIHRLAAEVLKGTTSPKAGARPSQ